MAKIILHKDIEEIRGNVAGMVVKRGVKGQVLSRPPNMDHAGTSSGQRGQRDKMKTNKEAYARIKADPVLLAEYERRARARGTSVWHLVSSENLSGPRSAAKEGLAKTEPTPQASTSSAPSQLLLAWTTVATRDDANRLARDAVERRLAACVQIDGPITSHYVWRDQIEQSKEFRLCFKVLASESEALEKHILAIHPYETPEWIVVPAERVSEKYLSWAAANSHSRPL